MPEVVPSPLLDDEEVLVDVIKVELDEGTPIVILVGPLDPVLVCEDAMARKTRQFESY